LENTPVEELCIEWFDRKRRALMIRLALAESLCGKEVERRWNNVP